MANGYTWSVKDGTVTDLKSFARRFVVDRDDLPLREEIPNEYYLTRVKELVDEIWKYEGMSVLECNTAQALELEVARSERERSSAHDQMIDARYDAMLAQVDAWQPVPVLARLKESMRRELLEARSFDCPARNKEPLVAVTAEAWRAGKIEWTRRVLEHAREEAKKDEERVATTNAFVKAVREAFP